MLNRVISSLSLENTVSELSIAGGRLHLTGLTLFSWFGKLASFDFLRHRQRFLRILKEVLRLSAHLNDLLLKLRSPFLQTRVSRSSRRLPFCLRPSISFGEVS